MMNLKNSLLKVWQYLLQFNENGSLSSLASNWLNDLIDWAATEEDNEDISVWEDNWDDDDVEDDFNQQLRWLLL